MARFLSRLLAPLAALGLLFAAPTSASLRVNPFVVTMTPNGQGTSSVVQLTNVTDVELPFEINVVKRTVVDGREVQVAADDDFVIFPPQMILRPNETQTLRIQWVGQQSPTTSESYYVYVTQVPVEVRPGVSGIRVSYRFGIAVHLVPPSTRPNLEVAAVRPATNAEGVAGFEVDVVNNGDRFGRLSEYEMRLDDTRSFAPDAVRRAVGVGFLLPGERSTFFVPYDGQVTASSTVSLAHRGPA